MSFVTWREYLLCPLFTYIGGKNRLFALIRDRAPREFDYYCEPFVGGAAILLGLRPKRAWVNDLNKELIHTYIAIRDDVDAVLNHLRGFECSKEQYMYLRGLDRDKESFEKLSDSYRAARYIYVLRTAFNGIGARTNTRGELNASYGRAIHSHSLQDVIQEDNTLRVAEYFNTADIKFTMLDYKEVLRKVPEGAFVYLDPPYEPVEKTKVSYCGAYFPWAEQVRLEKALSNLTKKNIKWLISHSDTQRIRDLYNKYSCEEVSVYRGLAGKASARKDVLELLISNY